MVKDPVLVASNFFSGGGHNFRNISECALKDLFSSPLAKSDLSPHACYLVAVPLHVVGTGGCFSTIVCVCFS